MPSAFCQFPVIHRIGAWVSYNLAKSSETWRDPTTMQLCCRNGQCSSQGYFT